MGWLTGFLGGLLEFFLLKELTTSILTGRTKRALLVLLFNMSSIMGLLVLVLWLWRDQLIACGIAMAATLIACALGAFLVQRRIKKEGD